MHEDTSHEYDVDAEPASERLLTPEDVSHLLGIPVKTLANWRSERTGPLPLRIGCHVRYRYSDVQLWLEERVSAARQWMAS